MRNPEQIRSRRFNSEKNAKSFCKQVKGTLLDLRNQPQSKSKFKVSYTKENAKNSFKNSSFEGDPYLN